MPKKGDARYSVPINANEFRMLSAFSKCLKDKSTGGVDERELQEVYSEQYREEYPFLDQLHIKEIRDILDEMCKVGIIRDLGDGVYELYATERGCSFEMIVGD